MLFLAGFGRRGINFLIKQVTVILRQRRGMDCGNHRFKMISATYMRQHNLERTGAPLGARRCAGVVDEIAFGDAELTVVALDFKDVGLDGDTLDLSGDVVHGDVAG